MAFDLDIDAERDLVKVALPSFHPGSRVLVDMREHVHQVDAAGIRQIAAALVQNGEAIRGCAVAVVVAREVSYGMMRMLQALVSEVPFGFSVHYELEEAERTLDLV